MPFTTPFVETGPFPLAVLVKGGRVWVFYHGYYRVGDAVKTVRKPTRRFFRRSRFAGHTGRAAAKPRGCPSLAGAVRVRRLRPG